MFIPEAGLHDKPIHFKNQSLPHSARRRIGSTDQCCTDDDMIVFYQSRRGETHDEQVIQDASMSDFDEEAIGLYRQLRREVDAQADEVAWNDQELLEALGAIKRHEGDLKPTVAGILLFGKSIALRRLFPMMRIDYIRVPALRWVKDPDRRFDTIEIRAPLIRAIQRARSAILDDLPKAFSLPAGEVQSKDIPVLPDRVIREVIANAIMHRDYRVHGSIQIIRYSNRLEIRNPGYSLKADERLGEPGSETRNPRIAAVLHDVKYAETKGSGIRVMRELMDERNLSSPLLASDRTNNSFMAMLLFHHFLGEDDLNWLKAFEEHALTDDEMKAMISAREVGAISNSSYRDINRQADTLGASKHLRKLCDCGLLEKKGQSSATYYVPTPYALGSWPPSKQVVSPDLGSKSPDLGAKSPDLGTKSPDLGTKSPELPTEIRDRIASLGGKGKPDDVLSAVVLLLKWRELSLAELANYLGRSEDHVRKTYLQPLVQADIIRRSNPEKINDPNQTYRAVLVPKEEAN
ncbi:MAG: ATP-binding protein [Pirellulaceae bacterium]